MQAWKAFGVLDVILRKSYFLSRFYEFSELFSSWNQFSKLSLTDWYFFNHRHNEQHIFLQLFNQFFVIFFKFRRNFFQLFKGTLQVFLWNVCFVLKSFEHQFTNVISNDLLKNIVWFPMARVWLGFSVNTLGLSAQASFLLLKKYFRFQKKLFSWKLTWSTRCIHLNPLNERKTRILTECGELRPLLQKSRARVATWRLHPLLSSSSNTFEL